MNGGLYRFPALPPDTYVLNFAVEVVDSHYVHGGPDDYGPNKRSREVFNVFNFQAVTWVNELSTTLDGIPIHETPPQVRLGLGYAF
ncbi:hypothetical protein BO221_14335 [Archangium sp. Cb G35]|uniref:hypothetical protein n=1 Tax=Archangium sp. Cb G35 TaxID=1920190 RepID=UPI000936A30F|nr:hypothetical protein [Archangium sp. Cb G35]OJT24344.1 hypothetical protein BO221_14335 [Archangium sp. Cb G35]